MKGSRPPGPIVETPITSSRNSVYARREFLSNLTNEGRRADLIGMPLPLRAYRRHLTWLTLVWLTVLALPPLALGWALGGTTLALGLVGATLLFGLWGTGGGADLPGTHRLVPAQAPGLFALVDSLARQAGLRRMPEVRLVPGGQTNAAAMLRGSTPVLVVTEALLARLDARRLGAVLAHEVSHLAHGDLVLFRIARGLQAATVALGTVVLLLAVFTVFLAPATSLFWAAVAAVSPPVSRLAVAALSRTREFAADGGAVRLTGDPLALADALEQVEYRPRSWWDWLTGVRAPAPADPAGRAFRTHPPTPERVRRLTRMARILSLGL